MYVPLKDRVAEGLALADVDASGDADERATADVAGAVV
jgi:hypothetical protein